MSECVTSNRDAVNNSTQDKHYFCVPGDWIKKLKVARFGFGNGCYGNKTKRDDGQFRGEVRSFADYIEAIKQDSPDKKQARLTGQREDKEKVPYWQLTQLPKAYCGTDKGERNEYLQIDLDAAHEPNGGRAKVDLEALKKAVTEYQGVIFAAKSVGGHGVNCLLHAPDLDLGIAYGMQMAAELNARGFKVEYDKKGSSPKWGRYEAYDPAPYVSEYDEIIAMPRGEGLARHAAKSLFDLCGTTDHEGAVFAMAVAAVAAQVTFNYSAGQHTASADIQIIGESGEGKTGYRMKPLETIAKDMGALLPGGIRTTDAALLDTFITAACIIDRDERDKVTNVTLRAVPTKVAFILDESGDVSTANSKDTNKANFNTIRRQVFSGSLEVGATKEMRREYGNRLPTTIPADGMFYRGCTPEQLKADAETDKGGNGRRVIYAQMPAIEYDLIGKKECEQKKARNIKDDPAKMEVFRELAKNIRTALAGRMITAAPNADMATTAHRAARLALTQAGMANSWQDTMIYNIAALLAAVRIGLTFHDHFNDPMLIEPQDIYAAADVAMQSDEIRMKITSHGLAAKIATARTEGERTKSILDYVALHKRVRRETLIASAGCDNARALLEGLCEEGLLTYTIENGRYWYSLTPDTDEAKAAARAAYADFKQRKAQPRGAAKGKLTTAERCDRYLNELVRKGITTESCGGNDNFLRALAGKLKANSDLMTDAKGVERWFVGQVTSGAFDEQGQKPYTAKDAQRLFRDGGLTMIA